MLGQPDPNLYSMQGFQQQQQQQQFMPQQQQQYPHNPFIGQRFRGIVKTFSESNGYGFIGGDEVTAALGKDAFLHQRDVTEVTGVARPSIPPGTVITFAVTINPKGQPQAREIRFEDQTFFNLPQNTPEGQAQAQQNQMMQPSFTGGQSGMFASQYVQGGRRFRGFVKSFSQINGFGFVGGDEITQNFGKDAFLHFRELQGIMGTEKPSIPSGAWLTFTLTLNQKGQPQARDVQFEPGQVMGAMDPATQQMQQMQPQYAGAAQPQMGYSQYQQPMQTPQQGFGPPPTTTAPTAYTGYSPQGNVHVSDAEAYARVQADIEKFQREVQAKQEEANRAAATGGEEVREERYRSRSRSPRNSTAV